MTMINNTSLSVNNSYATLLTPKKLLVIIIGTALLSFGLYNVHRQASLSEGGVLGLILLLDHWFGFTPALVSPALDALCYAMAFKALGKDFLKISAVSAVSLGGFFMLWTQFPPLLPNLTEMPLLASVIGGLFVGVGAGLVIRQGGTTGGDDALALTLSKLTGCRLSLAYLATDLTVLMLSLTYIPFGRIGFSIVTVVISSLLIDYVKNFPVPGSKSEDNEVAFRIIKQYQSLQINCTSVFRKTGR